MDALKASGLSRDPRLMEMVTEAQFQVNQVIEQIKGRLQETGRNLKTTDNKKKLASAYGKG
jgi:hypothetical protein